MKNDLKVKLGFVLLVILICGITLYPSFRRYVILGKDQFEALAKTDPDGYKQLTNDSIPLGLDLQGGMHLLLGVRVEEVMDRELEGMVNDVKDWLGKDQIPFLAAKKADQTLEINFQDAGSLDKGRTRIEGSLGHNFQFSTRTEGATEVLVIQPVPAYVSKVREDAFAQVMETLRNRVDQLGVAEPTIQRQGLSGNRILIQLPGLKDREQAKRVIGKVAELQFRIVQGTGSEDKESLMGSFSGGCPDKDAGDQKEIYTCPDGSIILPGDLPAFGETTKPGYYRLEGNIPASGRDLETASVGSDQYGKPSVHFTIKPGSSEAFGRLTKENLGKQMAIVLDGHVKSAPTLQGKITRNGEITGYFTPKEAYELSLTLRSGALPASVDYLEERTVGSTLGDDAIRKGGSAFFWGTLMVVLFMIYYYGYAGVNAVVSLAIGFLVIMAGLALFGATLTLPGIAGLVLTVGMGVDANVLIFERMRDELKLGRSVRVAIAAGFEKAFSAIADSNMTTVIAALLLFQFGTGPIRGFAVTLTLGVVASMFAALFISRALFDWELMRKDLKLSFKNMLQWLGLPEHTHYDFFKYRYKAVTISVGLTLLGVAALLYNGAVRGNTMNWGIDFSGGALLEIHFEKPIPTAEIRATLAKAGFEPTLQEFGSSNDILIRTLTADETIAENRKQIVEKLKQVKLAYELDPQAAHAEILLLPAQGVAIEALQKEIEALQLGQNATVSIESGKVRIKISEVTDRIYQTLVQQYGAQNPVELKRAETVGPQVGADLKLAATWALILAWLAQLIYISLRFEFRYAIGAILALFHDAWMAITVLAVFYMDIDMSVIAALLTVIGYSINDTIVVFDRVRENTPKYRKSFEELINVSTNEMLSRTILTAGTTMLSAFALFLFGGETIRSFAIALMVGVFTGTYSSIYVAAPLAHYYEQWQQRRNPTKNKPEETKRASGSGITVRPL